MAGFWTAATHINKTDSTTLNKSAFSTRKTVRKELCELNKEDHEKSSKRYTVNKWPGRNCALQLVGRSDPGSANVATETSYLAVEKFNAAPLFQWPILSRSQAASSRTDRPITGRFRNTRGTGSNSRKPRPRPRRALVGRVRHSSRRAHTHWGQRSNAKADPSGQQLLW